MQPFDPYEKQGHEEDKEENDENHKLPVRVQLLRSLRGGIVAERDAQVPGEQQRKKWKCKQQLYPVLNEENTQEESRSKRIKEY